MGEIAENCQGVKLVLVALKCDLREKHADEEEAEGNGQQEGGAGAEGEEKKPFIEYKEGLEVARRIQALRYLGNNAGQCLLDPADQGDAECSAKRNRGVNEAFTEAARVALSVRGPSGTSRGSKCNVM